MCSESEGVKQHTADGNAAHTTEQPGSEHGEEEDASVSSQSEDMHTSETQAEEEDHEGGAEPIPMMKREEEEAGCPEKEDGGGEKGPEVTSQQTDGSRPPGFLYKVSTLTIDRLNTNFSRV